MSSGGEAPVPEAAEAATFSYVNVALGAVFVYLLSKLFNFGKARPQPAEPEPKSASAGDAARVRKRGAEGGKEEGRGFESRAWSLLAIPSLKDGGASHSPSCFSPCLALPSPSPSLPRTTAP